MMNFCFVLFCSTRIKSKSLKAEFEFCAINKNEDKNTIAGTWRFSKVYAEGVQEDDWRYVFGSAGLGDGLILKKDKTFVDEVGNAMSSEDTIEGTYEIDGNNVILTFANGVVKTLKYDSKTETLDFPNYLQGCELILKK